MKTKLEYFEEEEFYCNNDDGVWADNRCAVQCRWCKEVEELNKQAGI